MAVRPSSGNLQAVEYLRHVPPCSVGREKERESMNIISECTHTILEL